MFHQAHNFSIHGGQINTVAGYQVNDRVDGGQTNHIAGDQHIHNPADPIFHLWNLIRNLEATHDTETYSLRGCHPKTRESIRKYLVERSSDPTRPPLCWLSGPVGAGKTAVAQSVAQECQDSGTLISSFFFSRNNSRRNEPSRLFLSIAYWLAISIPELRKTITEIIQANPAVLGRALDIQFQELIVKPCRQLVGTRKWEDLPRLIIIDGLDECQDSKTQKRLIETIAQPFTLDKHFPLRFLICSRPEPAIRETFDSIRNKYLVDSVRVDDSFQTRRDIETYLLDELTRIRNEARVRGLDPPHGWPGSIIYQLSVNASGHFSYASTVVKFADDEFAFPWKRVDVVLGLVPNPASESPFRDLDQLYLEILSRSPDRKRLLDILGIFLVLPYFHAGINRSPEEISDLLDLRPGEVRLILRGMHAVLDIPTVDHAYDEMKIHHASFTDFLDEKSRSGDYYIDRKYYRQFVISCKFSRLNKQLLVHRSSLVMVLREDWFLRGIINNWKNWCEGVEEPTDELLRILGVFDWAALLDANLRYMLTGALLELWDPVSSKVFDILRRIETIMKWLEGFPTAERIQNVINRLRQFSLHGFHISLPSPLSQAISTWDTIAKWVVLIAMHYEMILGDRLWRALQERQPIKSSILDSFRIVDWRDCQCSHQDHRMPVAFMECSYGVYFVPIRMFYSPLLMFLFDLSSSGVGEAIGMICQLARFYQWLQRAGPMPELLPYLHVRSIVPIMNNWQMDGDVIDLFFSWFKSFPEEYAPQTQALMKIMANEIPKKNDLWIRPYFRWTGSELVWVEQEEEEEEEYITLESKQLGREQRKRQMEESECVLGGIKRLRMELTSEGIVDKHSNRKRE